MSSVTVDCSTHAKEKREGREREVRGGGGKGSE